MDEKKPLLRALPKADMLEPGKLYSITINPDDKRQYFSSRADRFDKIRTYLINYHLRFLKDSADFVLYPECSNPWKGGHSKKPTRFHYHGRISFSSLFPWYSYVYNNLIDVASIDISPIKQGDADYHKAYITKNSTIMKTICEDAFTKYKVISKDLKYIKNRVSERLNDQHCLDYGLAAGTVIEEDV